MKFGLNISMIKLMEEFSFVFIKKYMNFVLWKSKGHETHERSSYFLNKYINVSLNKEKGFGDNELL